MINVKCLLFLCVLACVGETPHLISGEVFIDIDDEQPLVSDQVKELFVSASCLNLLCVHSTVHLLANYSVGNYW